jgi:hypothetical protein
LKSELDRKVNSNDGLLSTVQNGTRTAASDLQLPINVLLGFIVFNSLITLSLFFLLNALFISSDGILIL